jgi:hypothetical protein
MRFGNAISAWYEDSKENLARLGALVTQGWWEGRGERLDAGETAVITRQLTYVVKRTFDKKFPELKARLFLPVNYEVPEGAEAWSERGYTWAGMAKIIHDYAADLPVVSTLAAEVLHPLKTGGIAYHYSLLDLAKAAFSGVNIDAKLAFAAKRSIENLIEQIAAIGEADANIPGFLNNTNVTLLTAAGGDIIGSWDIATSDQILADLNTIANKQVEASKGIFPPDTYLLDIASYNLIMSKPFSDLNPKPVGRLFLEQSAYIKNIDWWTFLATADAGGTKPRLVSYKRDSEIVELMIMKEFTQLPPIAKALTFLINCYNVFGGVAVHYPMGIEYVDGIHS